MRSIFAKLLLSFSLTILLSGFISGMVMFSFTRRSVESFRHNFNSQLQANIARSVILMGRAAFAMQQNQSGAELDRYLNEIEQSMKTKLYLGINGKFVPDDLSIEKMLQNLSPSALDSEEPYIQVNGEDLIVIQKLWTKDQKQSYVVAGLHKLNRPPEPGMGPPPPEGPGRGDAQHYHREGPPPGRLEPGPGLPLPPPKHWPLFHFFRNGLEIQTIILLLVAGIVCYKLARSFSSPLEHLRKVSREIAAGNLSARVGSGLGKPGSEIGDLARDFDHMAERMDRLINSQKRLLLDISHELRSPLTRLNISLELAEKHFRAEGDEYFRRIAKESQRLNELIGQLLTLARMESQAHVEDAVLFRLDELVRDIAEDIDFETQGIETGVTVTHAEPITMHGSRELLRQAIENVIRNGAYYTKPGSQVEVSLALSDQSDSEEGTAVIRVRDYGPGVPEEKIPHILEPFFRVAEARDRKSGGTGIGLAIANQAVQLHGGSILLSNAEHHRGFLVEIVLPLKK